MKKLPVVKGVSEITEGKLRAKFFCDRNVNYQDIERAFSGWCCQNCIQRVQPNNYGKEKFETFARTFCIFFDTE